MYNSIIMEKKIFKELEDYLFEFYEKSIVVAQVVAGIVGVKIGLKSATVFIIKENELKNADIDKMRRLFEENSLELLMFKNKSFDYQEKEWSWYIDCFCAQDCETAKKLHSAFSELQASSDDFGKCFVEPAKIEEIHREIGGLLGYPETAIDAFIECNRSAKRDEKYQDRMARNRYYAHSLEHEEEEYQAFDKVLNQAVEQYAERSAEVLRANTQKRWL